MMNNNLEFLNLINVEHPKYSIGDKIRTRHINDDLIDVNYRYKLIISYGVIVGMIPNYKSGKWDYFIMFDDVKFDYELAYSDKDFEPVPKSPEFNLGDKVYYSVDLAGMKPQLGVIKGIKVNDNGVSYQIFDIDENETLSYGDYLSNIQYLKKAL